MNKRIAWPAHRVSSWNGCCSWERLKAPALVGECQAVIPDIRMFRHDGALPAGSANSMLQGVHGSIGVCTAHQLAGCNVVMKLVLKTALQVRRRWCRRRARTRRCGRAPSGRSAAARSGCWCVYGTASDRPRLSKCSCMMPKVDRNHGMQVWRQSSKSVQVVSELQPLLRTFPGLRDRLASVVNAECVV